MMESDAYSSFIAVDQELAAPVYSFGLIAGTQYAYTPELRHSLEVLKRAVQYWKSRGPLSFVAHLGNALSATNETGQQWPALHSFDEARRNGNDCKQWHLTPGAHDLRCFGASQLAASVMPCRAGDGLYYAFSPAAGWRVLVLDSYDVSLLAHEPGSDAHTATLGLLQRQATRRAPDLLAGLEGEARRGAQRRRPRRRPAQLVRRAARRRPRQRARDRALPPELPAAAARRRGCCTTLRRRRRSSTPTRPPSPRGSRAPTATAATRATRTECTT